jgi:diadenosine tetraphosphatase ApaH/serine/threonine PP2A family protein phosphatase
MRIAILGDVHSNIEALDAVVGELRDQGIDHWVQVGDVVGYGPDPIACIERIRELGCVVCVGNHDAAVIGELRTDYFNRYAKAAIEWTMEKLRPEDFDWLRSLPLLREQPQLGYTVVHGSLYMPKQFGYVQSTVEALESLSQQRTHLTFVGHSHVPACYLQKEGMPKHALEVIFKSEFRADVSEHERVLVNVGSVGQPRDEDPRAAYAIFDSDANTVEVRRVAYDFRTTQAKIRDAGLPQVLADRLALGV